MKKLFFSRRNTQSFLRTRLQFDDFARLIDLMNSLITLNFSFRQHCSGKLKGSSRRGKVRPQRHAQEKLLIENFQFFVCFVLKSEQDLSAIKPVRATHTCRRCCGNFRAFHRPRMNFSAFNFQSERIFTLEKFFQSISRFSWTPTASRSIKNAANSCSRAVPFDKLKKK